MRQAIQQGGRQVRFTKNLRPVSKSKIGRHNHGFAFMTLGKHLKQSLSSGFRKRDIASFIQNQQIIAGIAFQQATQDVFVLPLH